MTTVFNVSKTAEQYQQSSLFFDGDPGLVNTVNVQFPEIWELYHEMRSLDWNENEFDFSKCIGEFESAPKNIIDMMIATIMWQWEADSVASRSPLYIVAPFQPCNEVWATEQRISDNEQIHANTYSEIVRNGFKMPDTVISTMLENTEAFRRLDEVNKALGNVLNFSRYIGFNNDLLHTEELKASAFRHLVLMYFTMLCLEKIQFMASFAITFTICKMGYFQEIGTAVRKIAQDEFLVHVQYRKAVIKRLFEMGMGDVTDFKDEFTKIFDDVVSSEFAWTDDLFDGRSLTGVNANVVKQWVLFCASELAYLYDLRESKFFNDFPKTNPLPFMNDWFNQNLMQPAPQEQTVANYKINVVSRDDKDEEYDF